MKLIPSRSSAAVLALLATAAPALAQAPAPPADDIRGPKGLVEIPVPPQPHYLLWAGLAGGLLLAALIYVLWRRYALRKKAFTPREAALAALAALGKRQDALSAERFADEAALVVRQFIAGRFGIAAPKRTSEEFFNDIAHNPDSPLHASADTLKEFLKSCDLAKFAGADLDGSQRQSLLTAARGFVESAGDAGNNNGRTPTP